MNIEANKYNIQVLLNKIKLIFPSFYMSTYMYICAMYVFTSELQFADFVLQTADLWGFNPSDLW